MSDRTEPFDFDCFPTERCTVNNLVDILRMRAIHQPERLAYIFLVDGENEEASLTYRSLGQQARAIATLLRSHNIEPGDRALLLYPSGIEFISAFCGCLYAGAVAVPLQIPHRRNMISRLSGIVTDAQPKAVLTLSSIQPKVKGLPTANFGPERIQFIATDELEGIAESQWRPPEINSEMLAFLQYTSGSTSEPKGVMVTHRNLMHNQRLIKYAFEHNDQSVVATWLPFYHDMGLIGNILQPLYVGFPCILMSPVRFMQKPLRWLWAISRYKATTSGAPNFAYELCVRKFSRRNCSQLDLTNWNIAYSGAETVNPETIDKFTETFGEFGFQRKAFYPCYGLAEATLIVSGGEKNTLPVIRHVVKDAMKKNIAIQNNTPNRETIPIVGCGRTLLDQQIIIAHPEDNTLCAEGEIGEIWVKGQSVAKGYWNNPKETRRTFQARIHPSEEGPFLRTGDLGFIKDEELFIVGRIKDLIVIRGQNHYPQDIERTVEKCHQDLRPNAGASFSCDFNGEERLIIVHEMNRNGKFDFSGVIEAIRKAIGDNHEIDVHAINIIKSGTLPRTSSGKIQRNVCKTKFKKGELEVVHEWIRSVSNGDKPLQKLLTGNLKTEKQIQAWLVLQAAIHLNVGPDEIDISKPLVSYGLDSLKAIEILHSIETQTGSNLSMSVLFEDSSIADIAAKIIEKSPCVLPSCPYAHNQVKTDMCKLSYGQQTLWFLHQLAPDSAAYNISRAVRIQGDLDVQSMKEAFQKLVNWHASLRTTFLTVDGKPMQRILPEMNICFYEESACTWTEDYLNKRLIGEAHKPFDLETGPLLRIYLFKRTPTENILLLVTHHIVADLWSLVILFDELTKVYAAETRHSHATLISDRMQYTDYVRWQCDLVESQKGKQQRQYWQKQLAGDLPTLNLFTGKARLKTQTYEGSSKKLRLGRDLTRKLYALTREQGVTLYMTLLATFQILLYRYTGQEDILVGSPSSGRHHSFLKDVVGYLVNPIVLRAKVHGNLSFITFLKQVRQIVLSAFEHQDLPFDQVVEQLQPERDPSRSPIFQVMFAFQKAQLLDKEGLTAFALEEKTKMSVGGLAFEPIELERHAAQFDLTLIMADIGGNLVASLEYNTNLFDDYTISRMLEHFQVLLESIVTHPEHNVSELPLITEAERYRLLVKWNDTETDYPQDKCIHHLFEAQAEQNPHAVAVVFRDTQLTYCELNERVNQLAHCLKSKGVAPGTYVAIYMERSLEMIVTVLGILKAGAAYVPVETSCPSERVTHILSSLGIAYIITDDGKIKALSGILERLPKLKTVLTFEHNNKLSQRKVAKQTGPQIEIMSCSELKKFPLHNPTGPFDSDQLAYVIFTSGSTGIPKGIIVSHKPVINLFDWVNRTFRVCQSDRLLFVASLCFDLSVYDIFGILAAGGSVHICPESERREPEKLLHLLCSGIITFWDSAPAALQQLVPLLRPSICSREKDNLRLVFLSGDWIPVTLPDTIRKPFRRCKVIGLGGATEATVWSNYYPVKEVDIIRTCIPYGKPIQNAKYYILDGYLNPCPIGVPGELYIGGKCLCSGYINDPAQTAERFIPDPFSNESGARMYHTGDLARYLPDGNIEFIGRVDNQVKIRGFRIELGEIESVLRQHSSVTEAVVIAREDQPGSKRLAAYLVANQEQVPDTSELRNFLKEKLPDYMIPSAFVTLESLPLTTNGKLDRKALPIPDRTGLEAGYVAPRTSIEEILAGIFSDVLGVEKVGIHDNFFDIGANSILIVRVRSMLQETFNKKIPIVDIFGHSTISALAKYLSHKRTEQHSHKQIQERTRKQKQAIKLKRKLTMKRRQLQ